MKRVLFRSTVAGRARHALMASSAPAVQPTVQLWGTINCMDWQGQRSSTWNAQSSGTASVLTATTFFNGQPLAYWKNYGGNGLTYYQEQDAVGSERIRTTASAGFLAGFANEPFGDNFHSNGTDDDPLHFSELDHDSSSDTSHAQYRQLSTTEGRWMSPDPYSGSYDLSNPQSMNRYSYVLNNPLGANDPSGLDGKGGPPSIGGPIGGCSGAVYSEGANPIADLECAFELYNVISDIFAKPPFTGSLTPRPGVRAGGGTSDPWNESLGYPKGGPQLGGGWSVAGALGIPLDQGCEFGACGFLPQSGPVLQQYRDQVAQGISSIISLIHLPYFDSSDPNHRFFGTHHCGPGGGGGGEGLDQLCAAHDVCYNRGHVSWVDNINPFTSGAAMGGCDRLLCTSLQSFQPTSSQERSGKNHIQQIFGCGYILKQ